MPKHSANNPQRDKDADSRYDAEVIRIHISSDARLASSFLLNPFHRGAFLVPEVSSPLVFVVASQVFSTTIQDFITRKASTVLN